MKKIYLLLGILLASIPFLGYADGIKVSVNIPAGTYISPIDISFHTDLSDAKVFYYTDKVGRIDDVLEYTSPLTLSEDTQLSFFATGPGYQDSPIYTYFYTFSYPDFLSLNITSDAIAIQNNSSETYNIGLWRVETMDLNYTFKNYTFIQPFSSYTLPYAPDDNQDFYLIAPNHQIKDTTIYKAMNIKNESTKNTGLESHNGDTTGEETGEAEEENIGNISQDEENKQNNEEDFIEDDRVIDEITPTPQPPTDTQNGEVVEQEREIFSGSFLQTSVTNPKNSSKGWYIVLWGLGLIMLGIIGYNIFLSINKQK